MSDLSVEHRPCVKIYMSLSGGLGEAGKWASLNGQDDGDHTQNEL